jgi:hypothetical protein
LIIWWFGIKGGLDAQMVYIEPLNVILMPKLERGLSSGANFGREKITPKSTVISVGLLWGER